MYAPEAARIMNRLRLHAIDTNQDFIELTDGRRFDWQQFMLGQGLDVLRGTSIVAFVATFLPGISDPNRHGDDRWDFVAFTSNNTLIRFHPSHHQSAEVLYSATLEEWNVCGLQVARPPGARSQPADYTGVMLTLEQAAEDNLARHDKLGHRLVKRIIDDTIRRHPGWDLIDVTNGEEFQWWRYFANCGHQTPVIIGNGIIKVNVRVSTRAIIVTRENGSRVTVLPTSKASVTVW